MAAKKEMNSTLPLDTDNDTTPSAKVSYANEVVAIIAGLAANEVEGIAGMCSISGNILSKNRNVTKGVKVEIGTEEAAVDLYVIVEYGTPIQRASMDAQENVRKAIESMTGLHVVRVDVHVQGVSFEKENKAIQSGVENAALEAGTAEPEKLTEPEAPAVAEQPESTEETKPKAKPKTTRAKKPAAEKPEEKKPEKEKPEAEKPAEET
jgi:uncharacterized alkaline shock family protein YloU